MAQVKGLVVSFDQNVSEEYAERVKKAIEIMAHVAGVEEVGTSIDDQIIDLKLRQALGSDLAELYNKVMKIK